jgi:hypothetical protein
VHAGVYGVVTTVAGGVQAGKRLRMYALGCSGRKRLVNAPGQIGNTIVFSEAPDVARFRLPDWGGHKRTQNEYKKQTIRNIAASLFFHIGFNSFSIRNHFSQNADTFRGRNARLFQSSPRLNA